MATFKPTGLKAYSSSAEMAFVLKVEGREDPALTLSAAEAAWLWPLLKRYAEHQAKLDAEMAAIRQSTAGWRPSSDHDGRGTYLDDSGRTRDENTHQIVDPSAQS